MNLEKNMQAARKAASQLFNFFCFAAVFVCSQAAIFGQSPQPSPKPIIFLVGGQVYWANGGFSPEALDIKDPLKKEILT